MRDSFVFYRSFFEAIALLPEDKQAAAYRAICGYALNGEADTSDSLIAMVLTLVKPQLDANEKRRANGSKGGRPSENDKPTDTGKVQCEKPMVYDAPPTSKPIVSDDAQKEKPMVSESTAEEKPMVLDDAPAEKPNVNVNVNVNANVNGKEKNARAKIPPDIECVRDYIREKGYHVNAEAFVNHYSSNGWMVGKSKMRDWQAAVRTWESREKTKAPPTGNRFNNFPQRDYDYDDLERQLLNAGA